MEPDYLPDSEIFVSAMSYTPGGLHTHEDCTPFYDGGVWGFRSMVLDHSFGPRFCRPMFFGRWFWTL